MLTLASALLAVAAAQGAPAPQPLELTCIGGGTANKASVSTVDSSGTMFGSVGSTSMHGTTSSSSTIIGRRQQGFADQVDVRLFSGDDRIRLPRTILPPIHGGNAGWFKLKNVQVDARTIKASAAINFINNPKVYIDRVTGTISISGKAGDFSGKCEAIQADAPTRF